MGGCTPLVRIIPGLITDEQACGFQMWVFSDKEKINDWTEVLVELENTASKFFN